MEQQTIYHPDGTTTLASFTLKDGKVEGLFTVYRENGTTAFTRSYKDGKLNGVASYYHMENGALWKEEEWNNGVLMVVRYKY